MISPMLVLWCRGERNPKARSANRSRRVRIEVEQLETRVAPATLVNAHTVTYQDADGDRERRKGTQLILRREKRGRSNAARQSHRQRKTHDTARASTAGILWD